MKPQKKEFITAFLKACKTATRLDTPSEDGASLTLHEEEVSIKLTVEKVALRNRDFTRYQYHLNVEYFDISNWTEPEVIRLTEKEYKVILGTYAKCHKALSASVAKKHAELKETGESLILDYIK